MIYCFSPKIDSELFPSFDLLSMDFEFQGNAEPQAVRLQSCEGRAGQKKN